MEHPERRADDEQPPDEPAGYDPDKDPDVGPPATEETVDDDAERDQAEG